MKNGWDQVKDEIEGVAGFHASLATNLKREIINKLESYLSESEPRKKQVSYIYKIILQRFINYLIV